MELTHIGLFSGIGGDALAARWAGFRTLALCEIDEYCQIILRRNWPDAIIWGDIGNVKEKEIRAVRRAAGGRPINLITGGYPCQGESLAGHRGGEADDRWLWPEMFRLVIAFRPTWVVGENVAGHVSLGLPRVLSDLEGAGYQAVPIIIPACAIGALHQRDRVFIIGTLAHADSDRQQQPPGSFTEGGDGSADGGKAVADPKEQPVRAGLQPAESGGKRKRRPRDGGKSGSLPAADSECHVGASVGVAEGMGRVAQPAEETAADPAGVRLQRWLRLLRSGEGTHPSAEALNYWEIEPDVGRVVDGLSSRVDRDIHRRRLEALGNGIVPQQIYPILRGIAMIEGDS